MRAKKNEGALLNTEQAAAFLGLSPDTLKFWRVNGHQNGPPFYKLHRRAVRYSMDDLKAWLRLRRVESEAENG
ncbi:MAG: helix-turn-helix transcriptional regulator [Terriglobia bacterium]